MRKFLMIVCIGTIQIGIAQNSVIFAELGGNAQGGSFNYEWSQSKSSGLAVSLGIGFALIEEDRKNEETDFNLPGIPDPKLSIPFSMLYLHKLKNSDFLETGLGYAWINVDNTFESGKRGTHNFIISTGYRKYLGSEKKWMWKVNFSPIIAGNGNSKIAFGFSPMGGISIGRRF